MSTKDKRQEALDLVGKAYQMQMKGDVDRAIDLYDESLQMCPTAEAYTFRGWAKSTKRDFEGAIRDCHSAIDLDPEFGNPYNDIGAYYLELGQMDDAVPWLKMALKATRYENYCFPHYNLGRIYENLGRLEESLEHYRLALQENSSYLAAAKASERVKKKMTL